MRYLEDLVVGEERLSKSVRVSAKEIIEFAKKFDPQPFHIDPEAAKHTLFGGLIASGTHTLAYWRKMDDEINGDIAYICGLEYERVKLITPLRPGDDMFLKSRIIEARPSKSNPDRGITKIAYRVFNQKDETLATLTCASLVKTNPT